MNPNPLLDAALAYAARDWPVFPCTPGGKTPAIPKREGGNGVLDATTDPAQIRAWWTAMPTANVGIATGHPGPDVLDIDVKPGINGYPAFAEIASAGLLSGRGNLIRTRSGGCHVYFTGTSQRSDGLAEHCIDFKAAGGYVIAPPSYVKADDRGPAGTYEITSPQEATAALDWRAVRTFLRPPPAFTQPATTPPRNRDGRLRPGDDYAARTTWAQILTPHGWHQVRDLGNGHACWRRPGKTGPFTSATTREDGGLYVFSTSTPFDTEVPYSKFGAYAVLEHNGDHTAAARALQSAGYGTQPAPIFTSAPIPSQSREPSLGLPDYDLGALAAEGIKEPERIAGGMLYPGSVHCLAGVPGGGKTTLMAWWMLIHIRDGGHVMLLDEESGPEQAAEKFLDLGAKPDELSPPCFTYVPFPARGWNDADLAQLHERIRERHPGIIGWDSVAAFLAIAGHDENSAADVTAFWQRVLVPCARQFGAAVIGVDHTVKNGEHGGYGRGSGAKKAASDVQYIIETIKPFNRSQDGVLRLTTAPGKDRRGWLATAYEVHVKIGDFMSLDIRETVNEQTAGRREMTPGKAKLWEALNAIGSEGAPVTQTQLVDWIAVKYGHGLKRQTCSTFLNEFAADGLADSVSGGGPQKFWYPITPSVSPDASAMTRLSASAPLKGADTTVTPDTPATPDTSSMWPAGSIGEAVS